MTTTTHLDIKIVCLNAVVKFCACSKPIEIEVLVIGNSHQHLQTYFPRAKNFTLGFYYPWVKCCNFSNFFWKLCSQFILDTLMIGICLQASRILFGLALRFFTCMHCEWISVAIGFIFPVGMGLRFPTTATELLVDVIWDDYQNKTW